SFESTVIAPRTPRQTIVMAVHSSWTCSPCFGGRPNATKKPEREARSRSGPLPKPSHRSGTLHGRFPRVNDKLTRRDVASPPYVPAAHERGGECGPVAARLVRPACTLDRLRRLAHRQHRIGKVDRSVGGQVGIDGARQDGDLRRSGAGAATDERLRRLAIEAEFDHCSGDVPRRV